MTKPSPPQPDPAWVALLMAIRWPSADVAWPDGYVWMTDTP